MNKLRIILDTSGTEIVPNSVITALYSIGKDDDDNQSLTEGVDITDVNRPVSSVSGSIKVATAYAHHLLYMAVKYPNLNITADSTYIYFADPEVERTLLAAGVGDGVGISVTDAATANINRNLFAGNTTITTFDELPYFTRLNSQAPWFGNCINLESVDLSNVTTLVLNNYSVTGFMNDTKLKSIGTIPEGVTEIPTQFVQGCSALLSINIPSTCVTIGSRAFAGANLLTFDVSDFVNIVAFGGSSYLETFPARSIQGDILNLPNCTYIGSMVFKDQNFTKVLIPQMTTWSLEATNKTFWGCNRLKEVYLPSLKYTDLFGYNNGSGPFRDCNSLEKITISTQAVHIPSQMAEGLSGLKYVNVPETITNIGYSAFSQANNLRDKVLNLPVAIEVGNIAFSNSALMHIYLPSLLSTPVCANVYNNEPNVGWLSYRNRGATIRTIYFRDILSFGAGSFNRCIISNIIINNTTVPTLTLHTNSTLLDRAPIFNLYIFHGLTNISSVNIYVPDSAVAAYLAAPQFADVANRIKGMSDPSLYHITTAELLDRDIDGVVPTYEENGVTKPLYGKYCAVDGIIDAYAI